METLRSLSKDQSRVSDSPASPAIASGTSTDELVFPTTIGQRRFWALDAMVPGNPALNMPLACQLVGRLDRTALQLSLNEIVRRHEVLRTRFEMEDGELVQVVKAPTEVELRWRALTATSPAEVEAQIEALKLEEGSRSFDLAEGRLLRGAVASFSEHEHLLLVTMHHIASDGWSNGVLLREIAGHYVRVVRGEKPPFEDLPLQYADYSVWQNEWLKGADGEAQREYWKNYLGVEIPALNLPTDRPRGRQATQNGDIRTRLLSMALSERFRLVCQKENATPFMGYLAAYALLLHRYSGRAEFVVGSPAACRSQTELEGLIGLFANPLLFRARFTEKMTFRRLLHDIRDATVANFSRQEYPFELLAENLRTEESKRGVPWLQAYFIFQKAFLQPQSMPDLELVPLRSISPGAMFEWMLGLVERTEGVRLQLEFNTDLYLEGTIDQALAHLERIIAAAAVDPGFLVEALVFDDAPVARGGPDQNTTSLLDRVCAAFGGDQSATLLETGDRLLTLGGLSARLSGAANALVALSECVRECLGSGVKDCPPEVLSVLSFLEVCPEWPASACVLSTGSLESPAGWEELLISWNRGGRVVRLVSDTPDEMLRVSSRISVVFCTTELASACLVRDAGAFVRARVVVADGRLFSGPALDCLRNAAVYYRLRHASTCELLALWADHRMPGYRATMLSRGVMLSPGGRLDLIGANGEIAPFGSLGRARLTYEGDGCQLMLDDYFRFQSSGLLQWRGNEIDVEGRRDLVNDLADLVDVACRHPSVWSANTVVRRETEGGCELHVHLRRGAVLVEKDYRVFLESCLPRYLLPARIVQHESPEESAAACSIVIAPAFGGKKLELPVTAAGEWANGVDSRLVAEEKVAKVFLRLLKISSVDPNRSFFDLGGHSLLVLKLLAEINYEFGVKLSPAVFAANSSVGAIVTLLSGPPQMPEVAGRPGSGQVGTSVGDDSAFLMISAVVSSAVRRAGSPTERKPIPKGFAMKESLFARLALAPIYRLTDRASIRRTIARMILGLEGREMYSVTLRRLFSEIHRIQIGEYSLVRFDHLQLKAGTSVEKYCTISPSVEFNNADHPRNTLSTHGVFYHRAFGFSPGFDLPRQRIQIGNDVWIGSDARILYPTSKVGDGAVIAAGAVVVEDVPPYAVVGGYPATVLRYRFSPEKIDELMKMKWWDASLDELHEVREEFLRPLEGGVVR